VIKNAPPAISLQVNVQVVMKINILTILFVLIVYLLVRTATLELLASHVLRDILLMATFVVLMG
jgi:hypothetical protein